VLRGSLAPPCSARFMLCAAVTFEICARAAYARRPQLHADAAAAKSTYTRWPGRPLGLCTMFMRRRRPANHEHFCRLLQRVLEDSSWAVCWPERAERLRPSASLGASTRRIDSCGIRRGASRRKRAQPRDLEVRCSAHGFKKALPPRPEERGDRPRLRSRQVILARISRGFRPPGSLQLKFTAARGAAARAQGSRRFPTARFFRILSIRATPLVPSAARLAPRGDRQSARRGEPSRARPAQPG